MPGLFHVLFFYIFHRGSELRILFIHNNFSELNKFHIIGTLFDDISVTILIVFNKNKLIRRVTHN